MQVMQNQTGRKTPILILQWRLRLEAFIWSFLVFATVSTVALHASEPDVVFTLSAPTATVEIRLHVEIDDQHLVDFQRPHFEALFAHLDRDDNKQLDSEELKSAPSAGWLRHAAWGYLPGNHSESVPMLESDLDQDDSVSCAELQTWYGIHGVGSVTVVAARSHITPVLTASLWQHLDADHDNRLSAAEIANTAEALKKLDEDDDELISSHEIASSVKQPYPFPTARLNEPHFVIAAHTDTHATLHLASRAVLSLDQAVAKIVAIEADTETDLKSIDITPKTNSIFFDLGNCPCTFVAAQGASRRWKEHVEPVAQAHFAVADQNSDKSVTAEDASIAENRTVLALFPFADRNGDARVTQEEWEAALGVLGPLTEANVYFAVLSHDRALFELLDANRDSSLSRAELASASSALSTMAPDDLSTAVTIIVSLGQPVLPLRSSNKESPAWFVAMDRNHDGIVSRLEFIGTKSDYRYLDSNQDGHLSKEETD